MSKKDPYLISRWGEGFFDVSAAGTVMVKPDPKGLAGDLYSLTKTLVEQGIEPPILIRFNGIVKSRIKRLDAAFHSAINEFSYRNTHQMIFPVKVNPQRHVVETVKQEGKEYGLGFEVGSKPELIAVLALETESNSLLLCNGYKDAEYISLALMACKLGRRPLIIIEQPYELKLVMSIADRLGVDAEIGFRMKLSNKGTGRWESSGGERAKFGLFTHEIVECLEKLKAAGKTHWLKLLHFHIGSQLTTIESIKSALGEAARMYTEIARLTPSLTFFDVGGGLAVDYDGSRSDSDSSMNYTIEEYARNVVSVIGDACLAAEVPDPIIITESGRATVTHHCVLIVEVIDVTSPGQVNVEIGDSHENPIVDALINMHKIISVENCREIFHDAIEIKEDILDGFIHGKLKLEERGLAEKLYRCLLKKILACFKQLSEVPEEISLLEASLQEIYFCNFSVFQSLPDSWAINQLFPVVPLHRLNEKADHQAILADLSCDSDGKITSFIGRKTASPFINLHEYKEEPYYLGVFLVGAYQEIMGGLHNLFGDTNVVHAALNNKGEWEFSCLVEGDTIEEVLHYVQYNAEKLMEQIHLILEKSIKAGRLSLGESAQVKKKFKQALESYTYLVV